LSPGAVLDLAQDRLDILGHRARAHAGIGNGNQCRRYLVGKIGPRFGCFRGVGIESDFVTAHLPLPMRLAKASFALSLQFCATCLRANNFPAFFKLLQHHCSDTVISKPFTIAKRCNAGMDISGELKIRMEPLDLFTQSSQQREIWQVWLNGKPDEQSFKPRKLLKNVFKLIQFQQAP